MTTIKTESRNRLDVSPAATAVRITVTKSVERIDD